ncbi:PhoX family protein [Lacisediminimonas profundi]|uniref:PhoX family protein n=1 Tax=Lacisediminimonas profundi TaxID=2603856 RepID=UPI00124BB6DC|nr:PhoX family phosphatase [Lacisediminimonas profundi]
MNDLTRQEHLADPDDIGNNNSGNPTFDSVLQARLSRRNVLRGGVASAMGAMFGSLGLSACGGTTAVATQQAGNVKSETLLGFTAVAKSLADSVVIPTGYTATVLYALGDPLTGATPAYRNDGTDTSFENRAGDHADGMEYFGLSAAGVRDDNSSDRALLAMNHEAITQQFLHANGATANPRPIGEADKEIAAHGVSIVEVKKANGAFATVQSSAFNRRITPLTPIEISGVARGNALMKTIHSPAGTATRGTINNCGTGRTPWGTLLTGEENWAGYFARGAADDLARANDKSVTSLKRYGRNQGAAGRHGWETAANTEPYLRFNISKLGASLDGTDDYRNELNGFGYIVEIDPYDKTALIKKRTAMGRFAHESAAFGLLGAGKPVALYMGDDSQGEYIYKYVSTANWDAADASAANRIAVGDKYLDSGKLYVAKFNADGSGEWIELNIANAAIAAYPTYIFADQADVVVNARIAADAVGATKMDRPEWCGVHPVTGEIYYTLTNNLNRRLEPVAGQYGLDAANPRAYTDPRTATLSNPSTSNSGNVNGHIIRVAETAGNHAATTFRWDIYLFGAQSDADPARVNLSSLTGDQDFSSPDGLVFSSATGLCWIQTDDAYYGDTTNCMMLAAIPGAIGDGSTKTISYTKLDNSVVNVSTPVGKAATASTLKRFLVGPVDCEITGLAETPDGKTMFVNIQHPGETISKANVTDPTKYLSHWPASAGYGAGGATGRPRSATIVITKNDGGRIGS